MLKTIAIIVAVLVVAVLAVATTKPTDFRVGRSTRIKAPPEKIFGLIDDFHDWPAWSPYEKLDPSMTKTLSGAPSGQGARYAWKGNSKAGEGSMEIIEAVPPSKVVIRLDFLKPFEGHNQAEFTLEPEGDATKVTWAMSGPAPFMSRVMQVFVNMDRLIGAEFENGLANLKAVAEK